MATGRNPSGSAPAPHNFSPDENQINQNTAIDSPLFCGQPSQASTGLPTPPLRHPRFLALAPPVTAAKDSIDEWSGAELV
jgi:hypothetical protein